MENPASEIEKPLNVTIKMLNPVSSWIPFVATDHYHLGDSSRLLLSSITSSRADPLSAVRCGSLSRTRYLPLRRRESRGGDALPFVLCQVQNVQGIRQSHRIPNSAAPLLLPKPPQAAIVSLAKQQQQEQEEEQQQQHLCDTFGNAFLNCKETKRNVAATKQQQQQQQ